MEMDKKSPKRRPATVILMILVFFSAAYLLLLAIFRIPLPTDMVRVVMNESVDIDSVVVWREQRYDVRDRTRTPGFYSYRIETYCVNRISLPLSVTSVDASGDARNALSEHIKSHGYFVGQYDRNGQLAECYDKVLRANRRSLIVATFSDSLQSYARHAGSATIDRVFGDHNLGVIIHTSRGVYSEIGGRYLTHEDWTYGDWVQGWALPTIGDYLRWAARLERSQPDSAITLLSKAISMDDLLGDAYNLMARIYRETGRPELAEKTMSRYQDARQMHDRY